MKLFKLDFLFLLLLSIIVVVLVSSSIANETQKTFLPFDDGKIEMGSIINVPLHCPPDKIRVGNRCRTVF